jgi:hypothetical protein
MARLGDFVARNTKRLYQYIVWITAAIASANSAIHSPAARGVSWWRVQCGNQYMRAKKMFAERSAANRARPAI